MSDSSTVRYRVTEVLAARRAAAQPDDDGSLSAVKERAKMADVLIDDMLAYVDVYGLPSIVEALVDVCNVKTGEVNALAYPLDPKGLPWQYCAIMLDDLSPELRRCLDLLRPATPVRKNKGKREGKVRRKQKLCGHKS